MKTDKYILLDGAMGTMLQKSGVVLGKNLETLSVSNPALIENLHRQYIQSGAQIVFANTFGANSYKLQDSGYTVEQVVDASIQAAKKACAGTDAKVALDIGPIGQLLEPAGTLSFEEAYQVFRQVICQGVRSGADLIGFETMTDLYEVKAGVLAAKECCGLPVFVTMTFEENKRTFTGCSVSAMAATLEGLGVDAVGINCSLGPDEIYEIARELCACTSLPVIVKPNAGLPSLEHDGYDISAEAFCKSMEKIADLGVSILGGCCGTTPEYIAGLRDMVKGRTAPHRKVQPVSRICSPTSTVVIDGVRIIGERINPTGKKLFQQALRNHNIHYILQQAIKQVEAGADILDVNVGLPDIDEPAMMETVVKQLQAVVQTPLQIDSSNPKAIEAALRVYNGKAIVNSVNGEQKVLDTLLPIVKKYGAAVVGLTLDQNGIPNLAEERFAIAERILRAAQAYGIKKEDVYIDCLTLTASAQQKEVAETLTAVRLVKERLGLRTVLGVSNISFGLPNRELINHSFLTLALAHGLDLPIINPNISSMMDAVRAFNVLYNRDPHAQAYIERYLDAPKAARPVESGKPADIGYAIAKGLEEEAKEATVHLLKEKEAMDIVNQFLIPSLDQVGQQFETGKIFLPQLIQSAGAAQKAFEVIRESIVRQGKKSISKGKIIMATVRGDIHDIGKNIVRVILENYGYEIIDLGKDVPPETIVETALSQKVRLVGLSALMTTTLGSMEQTIRALREAGADCRIFVGGAVLTKDYAAKIGADFYAKDAKQAVDIAKRVLG